MSTDPIHSKLLDEIDCQAPAEKVTILSPFQAARSFGWQWAPHKPHSTTSRLQFAMQIQKKSNRT